MNLRRKALSAAAATVIAAGGLSLAGAAPAFAVNRAYPCNVQDSGNFLEFYSNASTCWANAGVKNVVLNSVVNAFTGKNAGEFFSPDIGTVPFGEFEYLPSGASWSGIEITVIDIN